MIHYSKMLTASTILLAAVCLALGMFSEATADTGEMPRRVYTHVPGLSWARSGMIPYEKFAGYLGGADVVFLGEYHDDDSTHALQLELLDLLAGEHGGNVVLSMEQFERDVQSVVNAYLAGDIDEEQFLADSRPWPNYEPHYRPLVEYCRGEGIDVVAANIPRPLASRVAKEGLDTVMASLTDEERRWVAESTSAPDDLYWENFKLAMGLGGAGGGHGMGMNEEMARSFYAAQCIKDDTMAESIARARERTGFPVVHTNGSFHSDYNEGTVSRVIDRRPGDDVVTIAIRPVHGWSSAVLNAETMEFAGETRPVADFIVYVPGPEFYGFEIPVSSKPAGEDEEEGGMPPMPAG
jgi:uncharacterized iron-regulated protein